MSKTTVIYKDIAVGADRDAVTEVSSVTAFSDAEILPFGTENEPIATLEHNAWMLDGSREFAENHDIAFWSNEISGSDGSFTNPPRITFTFDSLYTTLGLSFVFDEPDGDWVSSMSIAWYQGNTLKSSKSFEPNAQQYFAENKVEAFNKIVITLNATRLPYRRAKINQIVFGIIRTFEMAELRNARLTNEMSLSALELPVSRFSWTLDSREDVNYLFQLKQPVVVENNGNPIGVYYVDSSKRSSGNIYQIECHDAVGVLDGTRFAGGAYLNGVSALSLLKQVVGGVFDVVSTVADTTLYGVLKPSSRREAIQQIIFAWGVCAATDENGAIKVFDLPETVKEIGLNKTYEGVSVETSAIVTSVVVTGHTYTETSETSGVEIDGKHYKDATTKYAIANPNVTASDKENVITVDSATLVSTRNGNAVAQRLYNYYLNRSTNNAKVVWEGEKLGDAVSLANAWGETNTGHIAKMEVTLSNTVAVSCKTIGA
jgi:hypothetical protein